MGQRDIFWTAQMLMKLFCVDLELQPRHIVQVNRLEHTKTISLSTDNFIHIYPAGRHYSKESIAGVKGRQNHVFLYRDSAYA